MPRRFWSFCALLALNVIVVAAYWKLLTRQFTWLDSPDPANQVLPWVQAQSDAWHKGDIALWNPHEWGGQPMVGQLQPGTAYPFNWLLFQLPRNEKLWLNLFYILDHCIAAMGFFWLCRDRRRSRIASVFGGTVFALSGIVGSVGWLCILRGAIWLPFLLLFYFRSLERPRQRIANSAAAGGFLGLSLLSGHHVIPTYVCLAMAALWAARIYKERWSAWKPALAFASIVALVGALQILPALEYGKHAVRFVGLPGALFWGQYVPYTVHADPEHSLLPSQLLGLLLPNASIHDTFVGLTTLVLAAIGLATNLRRRHRPEPLLAAALGLGSLVFALGGFSLINGAAYLLVPFIEKARSPVMALVLGQFALALLAAFGVDACRARAWNPRWSRTLAAAGAGIWILIAALSSVRHEQEFEYDRLALLALSALGLALLLYAWRNRFITSQSACLILLALAVFEMGTVVGRNYQPTGKPGSFLTVLEQNHDIAAFLRAQPQPLRLEVDQAAIPHNFGDWEGIDQFQSYLPGITANVFPFGAEPRASATVSQRIFALTYFLGKEPARPGQEEVFRGQSGIRVFRNLDAFPRYWTVHGAQRIPSRNLIESLRPLELAHVVGLVQEDLPPMESCTGDTLEGRPISSGAWTLEAQMNCRGMVILSETNYPGWQATVDGTPAQIYEAYGAIRGVMVPQGRHHIEFRYRPASVYWGAALTALGSILAALAIWRSNTAT